MDEYEYSRRNGLNNQATKDRRFARMQDAVRLANGKLISRKRIVEELGIDEADFPKADDVMDAVPYATWLTQNLALWGEYAVSIERGLINWRT